jgi:hypothetical protein
MDVQPSADDADDADGADSVYRLSTAHAVRLVAPFEMLVGLLWIALAIAGLPRGWTHVLVAVTVGLGLAGAYVVMRPPAVLTLTDDGYRVGFARPRGRAAARWRDVESVQTADAPGVAVLVFALADGGRSTLPLSLLGRRSSVAQRDVNARLNRAHGYRRL